MKNDRGKAVAAAQQQQQPETRAGAIASVLSGTIRHSTTSFVFLLAGTTTLLSPNLSDVAAELGFSDRERDVKLGGRMKLAFYGAGIIPAIFAGLLSDVPAMNKCRSYVINTASIVAQASCMAVWWLPRGPQAYIRLILLQSICGAATGTVAAVATAVMASKVAGSAQSFAIAVAGVIFGLGQAAG